MVLPHDVLNHAALITGNRMWRVHKVIAGYRDLRIRAQGPQNINLLFETSLATVALI